KIFAIFVTRLTKAAEDNKERKTREEKAEQRQLEITHGGGMITHSASAGDLLSNGQIRRRPSLAEILESDDCQSPTGLDSGQSNFQREYRSGSLRRTNRRRAAGLWTADQDRDRTTSVIVGRNRSGSARSDGSDPPLRSATAGPTRPPNRPPTST